MEKWLFCDFDGTLRNGKDGKVDKKDSDFVHEWMNDKNKFILASGRPYKMMVREMDTIDVKPDLYVVNAGALIYTNKGELIFKKTIPRKYNKKLVDYIESMNLKSLIYATPKGEYYLFTDNPSRFPDGSLKREIVNKPFSYLYDQDLVCFKIIDSREKLDGFLAFCKKEMPELALINNTDSDMVEIHAEGCTKAMAVNEVKKLYKLNDDQIYVAGDDDNDTEMMDDYHNSFCIRHDYNKTIQPHATYTIDHLYEIDKYIK